MEPGTPVEAGVDRLQVRPSQEIHSKSSLSCPHCQEYKTVKLLKQ